MIDCNNIINNQHYNVYVYMCVIQDIPELSRFIFIQEFPDRFGILATKLLP
jgi:hypothetical protein